MAMIIGTKEDVDEHGNPAPFTSGKMTQLGLGLCPTAIAVQLRMQYLDQPIGESLVVGMQPTGDSGGSPGVLRIGRYSLGPWLHASVENPDGKWPNNTLFVFLRHKSR